MTMPIATRWANLNRKSLTQPQRRYFPNRTATSPRTTNATNRTWVARMRSARNRRMAFDRQRCLTRADLVLFSEGDGAYLVYAYHSVVINLSGKLGNIDYGVSDHGYYPLNLFARLERERYTLLRKINQSFSHRGACLGFELQHTDGIGGWRR